MVWLPMCSLAAVMMYQATNPALYYLIGCAAYFWAYCEGEVSVYREALGMWMRCADGDGIGGVRCAVDFA